MGRTPRQMRLTPAHVAMLPDKIDDPGPMPAQALEDPDFVEKTLAAMLRVIAPGQDVWMFAIGSLIWNKRFDFVEERRGVVRGWHRSFCMGPDTRYRGNPNAPAYVLALDRGGTCKGMVYRLPPDAIETVIARLLKAEPPFPPTWVTVATEQGTVRAFAFTAPRYAPMSYVGRRSDEEVADRLATAVGAWGSAAQYLHSTVQHLEALDLCDRRLWRLQAMVAERIEQAHRAT